MFMAAPGWGAQQLHLCDTYAVECSLLSLFIAWHFSEGTGNSLDSAGPKIAIQCSLLQLGQGRHSMITDL